MHIAEGLLPVAHALVWSAAAAPPIFFTARQLAVRDRVQMGMVTALIFAVTIFPVPIPIVGVTSHMCATPVLGILLGPRRVLLPTVVVLFIQALFFAHGGLSTLGANVVTLGLVGPWVGYGLVRGLGVLGLRGLFAFGLACGLADVAVYLADAVILALALAGAEPFRVWFFRLLVGLAPAQVPLALLEGVLSVSLARTALRSGRWVAPPWLGPRLSAMAAVLALVGLAAVGGGGCGGKYSGLDEEVFEGAGIRAGRHARPLNVLEDSELGRALFGGAMLTAGFVLGRGWGRLRGQGDSAPAGVGVAPSAAAPDLAREPSGAG